MRLAGGVDWIRLAQYRDRWRADVYAVINFRVLAPRNLSVESSELQ
jgi:aryl carrier-like protein